MSRILSLIIGLLIIIALVFTGYELGRRMGQGDVQSEIIENYSFVRDIAELASLEVNGVSSINATNLANDGSFTDAMRKMFTEQTVHLSVPYTAKFGVDLKDSAMRIIRKDSIIEIHLPEPRLLSYELRLDRLDASNQSGLFTSASPDLYTGFQKQLYQEGRAQLEANTVYRNQTSIGISHLLERYFKSAGITAICIFDQTVSMQNPKG